MEYIIGTVVAAAMAFLLTCTVWVGLAVARSMKKASVTRHFEKYKHHGKVYVWVRSDLKGKHRDHCLCFDCSKFHPGSAGSVVSLHKTRMQPNANTISKSSPSRETMRTLTNILLVVTLGLTVFLCNRQESDIISLRHWNHMQEGGLDSLYGGLVFLDDRLAQLEGGLASVEGGLAQLNGGSGSANGGLSFEHILACSATLRITEISPITLPNGPIILQVSQGTGVFVSDNVLLTAKHVVEDRLSVQDVTVTGPDGVTYTAVEILEDHDDDLAVVVLAGRTGPYLPVGNSPSLGAYVICVGTPIQGGSHRIITWGRVSSEKWRKNFIYDGFVKSGCSGGPVIVGGTLVGITKAYLRNSTASLGFATAIDRLDPGLRARF